MKREESNRIHRLDRQPPRPPQPVRRPDRPQPNTKSRFWAKKSDFEFDEILDQKLIFVLHVLANLNCSLCCFKN